MNNYLVFVDLETTGLYPKKDSILEIGIALVNTCDFSIRRLYSRAVHHFFVPEIDSTYVWDMHTKNKLLEEITDPMCADIKENIQDQIQMMFGYHCIEKPPMCGNSVHFDRAFLKEQLPEVEALFSYRNIDVSSLYELAKLYRPELAENKSSQISNHRVKEDIENSVELLKQYVNELYLNGRSANVEKVIK